MGRIRSIRPELWEHRKFAALPDHLKVTLLSLLAVVDDGGRVEGDPMFLRNRCLPRAGITDEDMAVRIVRLADAGFLSVYEHESEPVIAITGWSDKSHPLCQVINRPRESAIPEPDGKAYPCNHGTITEAYMTAHSFVHGSLTGDGRTEGRTDGRTGRGVRTDGSPYGRRSAEDGSAPPSAGVGPASAEPSDRPDPLEIKAIHARLDALYQANSIRWPMARIVPLKQLAAKSNAGIMAAVDFLTQNEDPIAPESPNGDQP